MSVTEQLPVRFAIKMPMPLTLQFESGTAEVQAEIRDLSGHGIFFFLSPAPPVGAEFTFTITLSEDITLTENIRLSCKGRVIRVEESETGEPPYIAASIESYDSAAGDRS